ncbi:hypothetical protein CDAR_234641 [Caerostris darwini]|uniref:Uncharacterized protein n=1 Tax=Caerostris darwini TaxID=1538125 RepID=A0AAV4TMA4_9ARAC|nr:hypothetical protein CDAR_234641 [Caerostris darwini]
MNCATKKAEGGHLETATCYVGENPVNAQYPVRMPMLDVNAYHQNSWLAAGRRYEPPPRSAFGVVRS